MSHKEAKPHLALSGSAQLLDSNLGQPLEERRAVIRLFIDNVLLDNIHMLEIDGCAELQRLFEGFVSTKPGISTHIDLSEIRDDIYDRVIDNFRPGQVSPILLTKAYFLVQNLIDEQNLDCIRLSSSR